MYGESTDSNLLERSCNLDFGVSPLTQRLSSLCLDLEHEPACPANAFLHAIHDWPHNVSIRIARQRGDSDPIHLVTLSGAVSL